MFIRLPVPRSSASCPVGMGVLFSDAPSKPKSTATVSDRETGGQSASIFPEHCASRGEGRVVSINPISHMSEILAQLPPTRFQRASGRSTVPLLWPLAISLTRSWKELSITVRNCRKNVKDHPIYHTCGPGETPKAMCQALWARLLLAE